MRKLWRKFVRWIAAGELDAQAEFYHYQLREYETSWRRTMEQIKLDRDVYKKRYEYIIGLQVAALSLQPMQPLIISDREALGSSAAVVAAKGKDKEA